MTDISAFELGSADSGAAIKKGSLGATLLSALVVVVFPACFWLSLLELANYALSLGISDVTRLVVCSSLLGILSVVWGCIVKGSRQS